VFLFQPGLPQNTFNIILRGAYKCVYWQIRYGIFKSRVTTLFKSKLRLANVFTYMSGLCQEGMKLLLETGLPQNS